MKNRYSTLNLAISTLLVLITVAGFAQPVKTSEDADHPKIVNIINFIRLLEPRDARITEDVLYQTVVRQVEILSSSSATLLVKNDLQ